MIIRKFEDIESWKRARDLTKAIYDLTRKNDFTRDYGLKDQIQRASVSIMANIAEGFDGGSKKSFVIFLQYAYRSATEVHSLIYVALDCAYIDMSDFENISDKTTEIKRLIGGFIQYLKSDKLTKH